LLPAGSSNWDVGHGVCIVRPNKGTMQGVIAFPASPAAPAERAPLWLPLQEFHANQSFTSFFTHL